MLNRFRGCLLGGAVGDALGAPVEFLSLREIHARFGPGGIRDYAPAFGRKGAITDDTQMTLFTAEGLLRAGVRATEHGIGSDVGSMLSLAYLRWLHTQGVPLPGHVRAQEPDPIPTGWLVTHRELFSRRAPGRTCISALGTMPAPGVPASNGSKGCGGVMRVAPVALFARTWSFDAFDLGCQASALTHGHPSGILAAGAFAFIIARILEGGSLRDAIDGACDECRRHDAYEEVVNALRRAIRLADCGMPAPAAIRELGEGWVAEEALAIGVYCALVAPSLEEGVILAVNLDGDSDSTGSIAGNLLGAMHGEQAIPPRWLVELELRAVIEQVAEDLGADPSSALWERYPGW